MRVLVTGASGGLGQRLLPDLIANPEIQVRALVHRTPVETGQCEVARASLGDPASLARAAEGITTVLHLAAVTHTNVAGRYDEVNREGTRRLLDASLGAGVRRFIYVSSSAAHPEGGGYARSKWEAERIVERSSLGWLILRPTEVYGPDMTEGVNRLIDWVRRWRWVPVIGDGRYRVCPVSVEDVREAVVRCVSRKPASSRTLVLGGPESMEFNVLVDRLARLFGCRRRKIHLPVSLVRAAIAAVCRVRPETLARDQVTRLLTDKSYDISTAARLLDYRPSRLEEGLRRLWVDHD